MNPVISTHLVDESIDGLLERLPSQPLVGHTALVLNLRLQHPQLSWRNVRSTCGEKNIQCIYMYTENYTYMYMYTVLIPIN